MFVDLFPFVSISHLKSAAKLLKISHVRNTYGQKFTQSRLKCRKIYALSIWLTHSRGKRPVSRAKTRAKTVGDENPHCFDTSCIGTHIGYVRRSENHGLSPYDWRWMLDFADRAFSETRP